MFFLSNRTCRTGLSRFGKLTFPKSAETKLLLTLYRIFGICSPCLILSIFRQVYICQYSTRQEYARQGHESSSHFLLQL